jgi:hypothetical protein
VPEEQLVIVDPADALEGVLSLATHRLLRMREVHAQTLHAGDPALVRLEGELLDRVARVSKVILESGLDERRGRLAERQGRAILAVFERVVSAGGVDEVTRARMLAALVEGLDRLAHTPAAALDADGLFPRPAEVVT